MNAGYQFIDHTADIGIQAWAPTPENLLVQSAQAVVEVLTQNANVIANAQRQLRVESFDEEDRLIRWLNEVLWLATGFGFVLADAELSLRPDGLDALVFGRENALELVVSEVKSATYHGVRVAQDSSGRYIAHFVLDV